jgi:mannose-1-phosphate guanylyltransferase
MYAVVLAGGGGTRLYPLSTPERPKPFLPLLGDETLLQRTVGRLAPLISPADVTVVTDVRYEPLVREQLPSCGVLSEPLGRNTAAAVALAARRVSRPEDDHLIEREDDFRNLLASAERVAAGEGGRREPLVTLGIVPTQASPEYGYLVPEPDAAADVGASAVRPLRAFIEKPGLSRARQLLQQPGVAWNGGVFLWTRGSILAALGRRTVLPAALDAAVDAVSLRAAYADLPSISIDYAVLEPEARDGRVVMMALAGGWSDLGGWSSLLTALGGPPDGRVVKPGERITPGRSALLLRRDQGRLELVEGNGRAVTWTGPMAYFQDGLACRPLLVDLIDRVERSPAGS